MRKRRTVAWLVACAVGLALVPATDAMAISKFEKKQNARIAKVNSRLSKAIKAAAKTTKAVSTLSTTVGNQTKALATLTTLANATDGKVTALDTKVTGVDNRLKTIEAAAPTIIANLTALGTAYPAVEYGRAGIFAGDADLTIAAGGTVTSADIPDDGNAITTGEDAIVVAGGGATNETLTLKAGIRSAESDGDPDKGGSSSTTAGEAGGYLYVTDIGAGFGRVACTGAPDPPGIVGTVQGDSIVTPGGTVTNLPLKNLPGGFKRTDTTQPAATSTTLAGPCQFAAQPGHTYQVHYSVNFVDIPTSNTPGPAE
jgi:hypothetical protein